MQADLDELEGHILDLEAQVTFLEKRLAAAPEPEETASADDFEQSVADIRKRDNCSVTQALHKARREVPEAFSTYQAATSVIESDMTVIAKRTPFEKLVDFIMREDGVTRSVAMARARRREPLKYFHYQESR